MKLFISFKFDVDKHYRYLLNAWSQNPAFEIDFIDNTPSEIQSWDIGRIKAVLTKKIKDSDVVLVIIGNHSDDYHRDSDLIGFKNWQYYEIIKAKEFGKKIIALKIDRTNPTPSILYNSGAEWVYSFTKETILQAINNVKPWWGW